MEEDIFEGLPKLTEDQLSEINDSFTHYLFYRKIKADHIGIAGVNDRTEAYECVCSRCGAVYTTAQELSHNLGTSCEKCGHKVTAKHRSYGKKKLYEAVRVLLICPENENRVWLRAFWCVKNYQTEQGENLTPEIRKAEEARYLLEPRQKARMWRWCYKGGWLQWCEQKNAQEPFYSYMGYGGDYYMISLGKLSDTFLRYIDFGSWNNEYEDFYFRYLCTRYYSIINVPTTRFICEFAQHPIIESLIKAGFGELVAGKIAERRALSTYFNWDADKLSDFFKNMDKSEIKWFHDCDYQYISLKEYALFKRVYGKKDIERYQSDKEIFGMCFTEILKFIKKYKLRYTHALNYLIAQTEQYRPPTDRIKKIRNDWSMLNVWTDYLRFANELGYDMKNEVITHPKELLLAHDKAAKTVAGIQKQQAIEKAKEVTAENAKKYAFEYAGLQIVIPTCPDDIIREGKKLHHCVGGYSDRHFGGKLSILFIRRTAAPDKPYVTMEVRGKQVVQVHGYRNDVNKPLSDEVLDFVKQFQQYINDPKKYEKARKNDERYNSIGKIQQGGPAA